MKISIIDSIKNKIEHNKVQRYRNSSVIKMVKMIKQNQNIIDFNLDFFNKWVQQDYYIFLCPYKEYYNLILLMIHYCKSPKLFSIINSIINIHGNYIKNLKSTLYIDEILQNIYICNESKKYLIAKIMYPEYDGILKYANPKWLSILYDCGANLYLKKHEDGIDWLSKLIFDKNSNLLTIDFIIFLEKLVRDKQVNLICMLHLSIIYYIEFFETLTIISDFSFNIPKVLSNNNWFKILLENPTIDFSKKIEYLINLYKINKLTPNFMIKFFDIYRQKYPLTKLKKDIIQLIDKFILLNSATFNFKEYRDNDNKTIVDKLKEIKHHKAIKILTNVKIFPFKMDDSSDDEKKSVKKCIICMDNEANICIKICGHFGFCEQCSSTITKCPGCRKDFVKEDLIKMYIM